MRAGGLKVGLPVKLCLTVTCRERQVRVISSVSGDHLSGVGLPMLTFRWVELVVVVFAPAWRSDVC